MLVLVVGAVVLHSGGYKKEVNSEKKWGWLERLPPAMFSFLPNFRIH